MSNNKLAYLYWVFRLKVPQIIIDKIVNHLFILLILWAIKINNKAKKLL